MKNKNEKRFLPINENQTFENISFEFEIFSKIEFEKCIFKSCSFLECEFKNCSFINSTFDNCTLSAVKVSGTKCIEVLFSHSKIIGVNWTMVNMFNFSPAFEYSLIDYSTFNSMTLNGFKLYKCSAKEVDFIDTKMKKADLRFTDFKDARFLRTDLSSSDLSNAKNYYIHPNQNILAKTKFSIPEVFDILEEIGIIIEY